MITVDNFELIKSLFYFNEANDMFFHCQIVQRAKDHKPNKIKEKSIASYFIRSREHLDSLKEQIVLLCNYYNARAYINISGKDFSGLQKLLLTKMCENVTENIIQDPKRVVNQLAGKLKSRISRWIVDIDDITIKDDIKEYLIDLYSKFNKKSKEDIVSYLADYIIKEIPTVHGCHLIVRPFNSLKFHDEFPDVDIHKNSMGTLLYASLNE